MTMASPSSAWARFSLRVVHAQYPIPRNEHQGNDAGREANSAAILLQTRGRVAQYVG